MSNVQVVSKFYYLEHGKKAPLNSEWKGTINAQSIVGFIDYTKRKESKELSESAKNDSNFFDYTSKRLGATKTYSNSGWLDEPEKIKNFKQGVKNHFSKDGDLMWAVVLSPKDFITSYDAKLYNEEDYAAALERILPKWFKQAGFDTSNMIYWMDYHVNTDNPHIHFNFIEKEKTKPTGKLPMKVINDFKGRFWSEVFANKKYLNSLGKSIDKLHEEKGLIKKDTINLAKDIAFKTKNEDTIQLIKTLYKDLSSKGRLQYNSTHMMPFRERLDKIVENILNEPTVKVQYDEFIKSCKQFDEVKSNSLNTEYTNVMDQEDTKLKIQLANFILNEFKNVDNPFIDRVEKLSDGLQQQNENSIYIPVAKSLMKNEMIRIPSTDDTYKNKFIKPMNIVKIYTLTSKVNVYEINKDAILTIYDRYGKELSYLTASEIGKHFDSGNEWMKRTLQTLEKNNNDIDTEVELNEVHQDLFGNDSLNERWELPDTTASLIKGNAGSASMSWMGKIKHQVDLAREEFLRGKELKR